MPNIKKIRILAKFLFVFIVIFSWIFSGWPQIWQNPPFPPKVEEVKADSVGPNYASTAVQDSSIGNNSWTNPGYATSSDNNKASVALTKNSGISYYIKATGFGFSIPSNAQINGIIVEWERSDNLDGGAGETQDNAVRIVKGDVIGATDKSKPDNWTTTDTFITYGSSTDLWGDTWTATNINSSNFGAAISCKNVKISGGGAATTGYVDSVRITIYYTLPTLTVNATGTQTATMNVPSNDQNVGGAFTFSTNFNNVTTTQIIITASSTFSAQTYLSDVVLFYKEEVTCSATIPADATQFNATGVGFNVVSKVTTTGTMYVATSTVCVYVRLDVVSGAPGGGVFDIEISNPSTEVTVSAGTVSPATPVAIAGSTTLQANQPPSVNNVSLHAGANIDLTENTTTSILCTATLSDDNGGGDITSATSTIYRSGVGFTCGANDNNCYQLSSAYCSLGTPVGNDRPATCTAMIWFHADPTDAGTYSGEIWSCRITAIDSGGLTGSATNTTQAIKMNTLLALEVTPNIAYGTMLPGETNDPLNKLAVATTTGNAAINANISGTQMCTNYPTCTGNTIATSSQHYATSSVSYASGYTLSGTPTLLDFTTGKPTDHPSNQVQNTYWGIAVPGGQAIGNYTGENTFTAQPD